MRSSLFGSIPFIRLSHQALAAGIRAPLTPRNADVVRIQTWVFNIVHT